MSVDYPPKGVPNCGCLICGKPTQVREKAFDIVFEYCSMDCYTLMELGKERDAAWVFDAAREAIIRHFNWLEGPTTIDNLWEKFDAGLDISDFIGKAGFGNVETGPACTDSKAINCSSSTDGPEAWHRRGSVRRSKLGKSHRVRPHQVQRRQEVDPGASSKVQSA